MSIEEDIRAAFERHAGDVSTRSDAWAGVRDRVERNHRRRVAAVAFAAGLAVASLAVGIPRLASRPAPPIAPDETRPLPEAVPQLVAKIKVNAVALAAGDEAIWAVSKGPTLGSRGTLVRVDPRTNRVISRIKVGLDPVGLAVGDGSIWVVNGLGCGDSFDRSCEPGTEPPLRPSVDEASIWRIDEDSGRVVAKINTGVAYDVAVGSGFAWYTAEGAAVKAIDLRTNMIAEGIAISVPGTRTVRLDLAADRIWTVTEETSTGHGFLHAIDLRSREVIRSWELQPAGTPPSVVAGVGAVWATTGSDSSAAALMRIDLAAQGPPQIIPLPDAAPVGLTAVTTGNGYLWATGARGFLWKVDPATSVPTIDPILIGDAPPVPTADVVTGFNSIWVASGDGAIWRFDP